MHYNYKVESKEKNVLIKYVINIIMHKLYYNRSFC